MATNTVEVRETAVRPVGSRRMATVEASATLEMAKKVRALRTAGKDILNLTLGEPDFDTPRHIKNAAVEAIRASFTKYPPVAGIPELRQAVANAFRNLNGLDYKPEEVVVSTGAKQALFNAAMCLVDPGDEVLVPAPYWVSYLSMIQLADGVPVLLHAGTGQQFKITPEQLAGAITPRTRLLILNSPNNPTGMMYGRAELEAFAEVLRAHPGVYILSDEIYSMITYGPRHLSFGTLPGMRERTITVSGVSKSFSMTGWRIGYAAAPAPIAALLEKYQGQVTSGACAIAQKAAHAALHANMSSVFRMRTRFRQRRDLCLELFAELIPRLIVPKPEGAFYLYPDVSAYFGAVTPGGLTLHANDDLCDYLLEEAGVATVSGSSFGTPEHIRLSYAASSEVLRSAIGRMAAALEKLRPPV